jgi:hypothetical protein
MNKNFILNYILKEYLSYKCVMCLNFLDINKINEWIFLYDNNYYCNLDCYLYHW